MIDYTKIVNEIKKYAHNLSWCYIRAYQQDIQNPEILFLYSILKVMHDNRQYLAFMNTVYRQDLIDCLKAHSEQYLALISQTGMAPELISNYQAMIPEILFSLETPISHTTLSKSEIAIIAQLVYHIVQDIQVLFVQHGQNRSVKDHIQATSIAFDMDHLSYTEQNLLIGKMLLIKELWSIELASETALDNPKVKFLSSLNDYVDRKINDVEVIIQKFIKSLIINQAVLEWLEDTQLVHLYDRLKNYSINNKSIRFILDNLHKEAKFRYTYSRPSDTVYELLHRFQYFDAFHHQINSFKFAITTAYLLHNKNFISICLTLLIPQIDIIHALGLAKSSDLSSILNNITTHMQQMPVATQQNIQELLSCAKDKINSDIEQQIQRKCNMLDSYATASITLMLGDLLRQIKHLLQGDAIGRKFLHTTFAEQISMSFYVPNITSSLVKMRKMYADREQIKQQLLTIKLTDMFLHLNVPNMLSSFDFTSITTNAAITAVTDFLHLIIQRIVTVASVQQLAILYKPTLKKHDLNEVQSYLQQTIEKEIKLRTSFFKRMLYKTTSHKLEYEMLCALHKQITNHQ